MDSFSMNVKQTKNKIVKIEPSLVFINFNKNAIVSEIISHTSSKNSQIFKRPLNSNELLLSYEKWIMLLREESGRAKSEKPPIRQAQNMYTRIFFSMSFGFWCARASFIRSSNHLIRCNRYYFFSFSLTLLFDDLWNQFPSISFSSCHFDHCVCVERWKLTLADSMRLAFLSQFVRIIQSSGTV